MTAKLMLDKANKMIDQLMKIQFKKKNDFSYALSSVGKSSKDVSKDIAY